MELLKQRILRDGQVKEGGVLKVDSFLNHQMDVTLLNEIGREFRRRFDGAAITKIVTIEASGIGIAAIAAQHFGSVPVIFAKKTRSRNLDGALYTAKVHSFTKDITYDVQLSKKFLGPQDTVLILDDFLARGQARKGSTIILVAVYAGMANVDLAVLNDHELDLNTSMMYRHEDYLEAIRLVNEGKVRLEPLMSRHFPFRDYLAAYRYIDANRETTMKVLIDVDESEA